MAQQQMSLLPVPDDWEANMAELSLTGSLGLHPDLLSMFDLGDRIEITVVAEVKAAGFKEKETGGVEVRTVTRSAALEGIGGARIRHARKHTSVFRDVELPDSLAAALGSQTTVDALADAALGATGDGIDSVTVSTSGGKSATRTRRGKPKPPENVDPATGEVKEPAAAPAANGDEPDPLTDGQIAALRVLGAEPGADLEQFVKSLNAQNGVSYDPTEAKAVLDLLIRRHLAVLTEHNDYELTSEGEALIAG